ncbi:MAG TPA: porin [Steroidobacteraceae bacterium]|nr:porin [Steroidobacteraceae bacterium]
MVFSPQTGTHRNTRRSHVTSSLLAGLLLALLARHAAAAATSAASATANGATAEQAAAPAADAQDAAGSGNSQGSSTSGSDDLQALNRALQRAEKQIRDLEKRLASDEALQSAGPASANANAASADALSGTFGESGFTWETADHSAIFHFETNLSMDYRTFLDSYTPATADTFLVRKARPIFEGTFDDIFDFRFMPDFGQGKAIVQDAWIDARAETWLVLTAGKFKAPVGLERLQLERYARFIEASLTADLLPYRDLGFQASGELDEGILTYQAGVFDGAPDGGSTDALATPDTDSSGKFTYDARVFSHPFIQTDLSGLEKLGLGIAGTYVNATGTTTKTSTTSLLASDKTPGQQPMFSYRSDTATGFNNATVAHGIERRWVPQANYYYRSFGLLGEYVKEDQQVQRDLTLKSTRDATLENRAWEVQGYYFLTGEDEAYDTARPNHPIGQGGFGAVELVARVHSIHFDNDAFSDGALSFANIATAASAAHAVGTGVNWYLTDIFRVQLDYEITHFEGDALHGNRPEEEVLTTQFALIF